MHCLTNLSFFAQEQKRIELELARRLKEPVDDMCLKDHRDMPEFERIPGVLLSGETLANCLMVIEFCINFREALRLGEWLILS